MGHSVVHVLLNKAAFNQYLGKIEQAHDEALFLVSSKACDEVGTFAVHNKYNQQTLLKQMSDER